ncbi:2Fe-2S iron-sulfur cluster-binding protein [Streptomyces sp. JV176]|uniref:(2Fe-2S)-binding protein n=1 Tax=Streptomyces sp. JV176 TaxID=858630 RepID=UPI002E7621D3|nr:2Fe-2S iron-sulfur cluster-binding protein [Streptomyces sp. JV176]MEE1802334.1 2Fe-2S iron-sulfur cluster-binding protein [Streptomyces sp. JV176]
MTTNDHSGSGQGAGPAEHQGGWQPVPHGGDYDAEATAFVQLPPEDSLDAPLAAPGHGYVPPSIEPQAPGDPSRTDQAGPGGWAAQPVAGAQDAAYGQSGDYGLGGYGHGGYGPGGYEPQGTSHWNFSDVVQEAGAHSAEAPADAPAELTGQWTIPVAGGDLPDESGEFSTSVLASQWAGEAPPATLPGGAPAPWAPEPAEDPSVPEPAPETEAAPGPVPEAAPEPDHAPDASPDHDFAPLTHSNDSAEHPAGSYVLRVNGADRPVTDAWIGESLLYVLRERLGLAGAKDGCSQGECGACNVQVDGRLVASCLVPAATAAGSEVRTVEGLAVDGEPSDVQRALAACGAVQCGFCVPGMAMTVHDLLEGNHAPTELETRQALCGNLCRCSGYRGVLDAVGEVVAERQASAEAAAAASEEARIPHQAPPGTGAAGDPHTNPNPHPHSPDGGMA